MRRRPLNFETIRNMNRNVLVAGGITAVAVLWLLSGVFTGSEKKIETKAVVLKTVQVQTVEAEPHQRILHLVGRSASARAVNLVAETSGRVDKVAAQNGQPLKYEDLIVKLDLQTKPQQLRAAQARVKAARLEVQAARRLNREGFQAATTLAAREADLAAAEEALALAQKSVDDTAFTAPFDGIVDQIMMDEGQYVNVGNVVASFVDDKNLLLQAPVSQLDRGRLQAGQKVTATLASGMQVSGTVASITSQAAEKTRTFLLEATVDGNQYPMPLNVTADVAVETGVVPSFKIPHAALVLNNDGDVGVRATDIVSGTAVVRFVPVVLLEDTPNGQWVQGPQGQTHVIVRGQAAVIAGQNVQAVPAEAE